MYAKSVIKVKNRTKKREKKYEKLNQNFFLIKNYRQNTMAVSLGRRRWPRVATTCSNDI